jgi:hypothetical protein
MYAIGALHAGGDGWPANRQKSLSVGSSPPQNSAMAMPK